jgi:hypothetical protein
MATTEKEYNPTAGVNAMLNQLHRLTAGNYEGLERAKDKLQDAQAEEQKKEEELKCAKEQVAIWKRELKAVRYTLADLINDLGKLGCPPELIKQQWSGYNAHDIAEWIREGK